MPTLGQLYSHSKNDFDMTTKKSYFVGVSHMYIEEGYNIRDIDWEHVHEFKNAYIAGDFVPPLVVDVTEKGIKVLDGHHRFLAIHEAIKEGHEITRVECKDFVGKESDKIALMVTSSQGRALNAAERATAYYRLFKFGLTIEEIAKKVNRSASDVREHLKLAECEPEVIEMVKKQELNYSDAIALQKEHGASVVNVVKQALTEAKAQGKNKVVLQKFNHKKAYTTLSAEVNNIIDFLSKQQSNTDIVNADETLKLVFDKLQQTMEVVRSSGWQ